MSGFFITIFAEPTQRLAEFYERLGIRLPEEKTAHRFRAKSSSKTARSSPPTGVWSEPSQNYSRSTRSSRRRLP